MKRPRRPAGEESGEEDGDDERDGERPGRPGPETSSNSSAKRALAARVAGVKPAASKPRKPAAKKPAAKAEPAAKKPAAEGDKPAPEKRAAAATKPAPKKPAAEATKPAPRKPAAEANRPAAKKTAARSTAKAKPTSPRQPPSKPEKVHRPRRQPDDASAAKPRAGRREKGDAKPKGVRPGAKAAERSRSRRDRDRKRGGVGRRLGGAARSSGAALQRGAAGARKQLATGAPRVGGRLLAALVAFYAVFFAILGRGFGIVLAAARIVAPPLRRAAAFGRRIVDGASRIATPTRVLGLVVAGAAVLLALSQFADYRSISIGNGAYAGVEAVTSAPETARAQTGDAHSYVFVPIAIGCLLLLAGAMMGRWRLCRLISLAGLAAVVVAVVVDRPAGLDAGDVAVAFEGVQAKLIGGFYAQIAAGLVLAVTSTLLARELRLAAVTATEGAASAAERGAQRERSPKRALRTPPPDAGGARA